MTQDGATPRTRAVRVRTDVAAVAKTFDYSVPAGWGDDVRIGTRVRVAVPRSAVRGWVVDEDVRAPAGVDLLPLKSWLGWGPPPALVELAEWAAWRWAGPTSFFLRIASSAEPRARPCPRRPRARGAGAAGRGEPATPHRRPGRWDLDLAGLGRHRGAGAADSPTRSSSCCRSSPTPDVPPGAAACSSWSRRSGWAERLASRLVRRGHAATTTWEQARAGWPVVVGSRAGGVVPRPAAGGRRRPRRARRGLPGGERAHLQRGRRRARAGPP